MLVIVSLWLFWLIWHWLFWHIGYYGIGYFDLGYFDSGYFVLPPILFSETFLTIIFLGRRVFHKGNVFVKKHLRRNSIFVISEYSTPIIEFVFFYVTLC